LGKALVKAAYGDFQTPVTLAQLCCEQLWQRGLRPKSILEPTCGLGHFLHAALQRFPSIEKAAGFDISQKYLESAAATLSSFDDRVSLSCGDFFSVNWQQVIKELPAPLLILGNPPWVTNSELSRLEVENRPQRKNREQLPGIEALMGKSNFDISEWMIQQLIEQCVGTHTTVAMLCKSGVARKTLLGFWKRDMSFSDVTLHKIDASKHFLASVDACFFQLNTSPAPGKEAQCFESLQTSDSARIGYAHGRLIADWSRFENAQKWLGSERMKWRSGVKHDCAKIMELEQGEVSLTNGLGDLCDLEDEFLYPLLKSSDLMKGLVSSRRRVLVTQKRVGAPTGTIADIAPRTWDYLLTHGERLDRRRSVIYKKKPRFSIFGIGPYSFAPWKVAISGFTAKLCFHLVGPGQNRCTMLDDTCYFLPFQSKEDGQFVCQLLNSKEALDFYEAFVFWDAKRPVTASLLSLLDLLELTPTAQKSTMTEIIDRSIHW
jgi:hypothetical protein